VREKRKDAGRRLRLRLRCIIIIPLLSLLLSSSLLIFSTFIPILFPAYYSNLGKSGSTTMTRSFKYRGEPVSMRALLVSVVSQTQAYTLLI
jgi:hypothetical protein